jgi:integrase
VPRTTPHDLRHTAASLAVSAGANVKAVQRMLGHASAAMTLDIYADLFDDDLEAVAVALDHARSRENVGKMWARGGQLTQQRDDLDPTIGR